MCANTKQLKNQSCISYVAEIFNTIISMILSNSCSNFGIIIGNSQTQK